MIASLGWGVVGRRGGGATRTTAATGESCEIYTTVNFVDTQSGVCVQYMISFCTDITSASSRATSSFFLSHVVVQN